MSIPLRILIATMALTVIVAGWDATFARLAQFTAIVANVVEH